MKVLLAAINAKYIHSNLAVYSLRAYAKQNKELEHVDIELAEYTINWRQDDIMMDIYEQHPDILCFSCYIWNLTYVEALIRELNKICPAMPIWLGGPEVSYDAVDVLKRLPQVKGVMMGEGEITFGCICKAYGMGEISDTDFEGIAGITFRRESGEITANTWRGPMDLSEVPFVYQDMKELEHKIIYYETSRGCPFSCSYCLSSVDKQLRFRKLDLVKQELQFFIDHKVPQVKFVDRTFNCKHKHTMEIWTYIKEHDNGITNFHFEVSADLLMEDELLLMETMRPGLIQLEIGVQSTNPDTIREIHRTMDYHKLAGIVNRIHAMGNIHQHLDLIAGLPFEDYKSFSKSFDDVYSLKPQKLQLGFLKVLKGSYMEEMKNAYGLVYKSTPQYEVLYTTWLPYDNVLRIKGIEEMVEVYYNSRQFEYTLEVLEREYDSAFNFYEGLWDYYKKNGFWNMQHKRSARYEILLRFITEKYPKKRKVYQEYLTYDYYLRENAKTRPDFAGENTISKEEARRFYEREAEERRYLPAYKKCDKNQMRRMTHLEYFEKMEKVILFDYLKRNPLNLEARTCTLLPEEVKYL